MKEKSSVMVVVIMLALVKVMSVAHVMEFTKMGPVKCFQTFVSMLLACHL